MPESFEDNNKYESTGKQIDALDKSINNLDNKNQERIDFTKHMQEIQNIYNTFTKLEVDISSITDENEKKNLQDRLDNLKITMMDLISDGSINNLIDGKTKDEFINNEVTNLNELLSSKIKNLIKSLETRISGIDEILSGSLTEESVVEILSDLSIPYGEILVGDQYYLGFISPLDGETYAIVEGELRACEPISDSEASESPHGEKEEKPNIKFSYSEKQTKGGVDNPTLKKETRKVSQDLGNGFNGFVSMDSQGYSGTPRIGASWKGLDSKLGDTKMNTQITASYSPGSIGKSMVEKEMKKYNGGWKGEDVYKLKIQQSFKFKHGLSLNISEIFKTKDSFELKKENFSTEIRASYRPKSNIDFSAIATVARKPEKLETFIGGGVKWNF